MRIRGIIEGFYAEPWSHEERLDLLRFAAAEGFNTWVHAPKDDPYHRRLWREPYPDAELERLAELASVADRLGVDFAYALAPGLDVCYSQEAEWEALLAKVEQVRGAGVRTFQPLGRRRAHAQLPEGRGVMRARGATERRGAGAVHEPLRS